jgi:hypothetical protein
MNEFEPIVAGWRSWRSQSAWMERALLKPTVASTARIARRSTVRTANFRRRFARRAVRRWRRWFGT